MNNVEKTVFISYRRTNSFMALAVYQDLTKHGFDVFFDYNSIDSGDFEQIILGNIKSRAHFLLILTPSALERCEEPNDWLRREIETALDEKRNIVPLMFEGFDYSSPSIGKYLTGKLAMLKNFNAQRVPVDFFEEAMAKVRSRFLTMPLNMVIYPRSSSAQAAADKAQLQANKESTVSEKSLTAQELSESARQKIDAGNYDGAFTDADKAIRLKPDYYYAYEKRGLANYYKGWCDEAIADYSEAIRLNPSGAAAYINRGFARETKKGYDGAIADATEAIRLKPDDADAYLNRGVAYYNGKRDYRAAKADWEKALQLNPNDANARKNLELLKGKL